MADQKEVKAKGGTMRLGAYACLLEPGSLAHKVYGRAEISERHRHRYEVNNAYRDKMQQAGLIASGLNPELGLVEMIELRGHPYFIGCQFHPEFQSKPFAPHPLFTGFIKAALESRERKAQGQLSQPPPINGEKAAEAIVSVIPIARA
jgi:CTP synthase